MGAKTGRRGRLFTIAKALLFVGNGVVFPIAAYFLRHVDFTRATWRHYLEASLIVGLAAPLAIVLLVSAAGLVASLRGQSTTPPLTMAIVAILWSLPGLISNHGAVSDLRHGPTEVEELVQHTNRIEKDASASGDTSETYWLCRLTFADGHKRDLDRYAVHYSDKDPCHGIHSGDRVRLTLLPHVDELVSVDDLGGDNATGSK